MPLSSNVPFVSRPLGDAEFRLLLFSLTPDERPAFRRISETLLPSFREACEERGARLVLVDPHSATASGDSSPATHVAHALTELQAGTFFIGLMGPPTTTTLDLDITPVDPSVSPELQLLSDENPGLADALRRGMRPGDIVILEGVVRKPERMKHRAAFFLREPATGSGNGRHGRQRLQTLKRDLQQSGFPIRRFDTMEQLIARVGECLHGWLDRWFPADELGARVERERREHAAYRASYSPAYMQRPRTMSVLDGFVDREGGGLLWVTGPRGIGKTSLLVNWVRRFREESPATFVIEHYVGGAPSSRNVIGFMRRVLSELKLRFDIAEDVPVRASEVIAAYSVWLSNERPERIVLVIDGIDQFEGPYGADVLLPDVIASHVHIVASAMEPCTEKHRERETTEPLPVPGLAIKERQKLMADDVRARHPHPLPRKLLHHIAALPAAQQAFHSQLVARVLTDPRLTERDVWSMLDRYQGAGEPDELLDMILEDIAAHCAALPVEAFITALWASNGGLTVDDLAIICGAKQDPAMERAESLVAAFAPCLARRDGAYALAHAHITAAVERRYLRESAARRDAHRMMADLLMTGGGSRRTLECMWQLKQAGVTRRLHAELSRIETLVAFEAEGREHELLMYWEERNGEEIERRYLASLDRFTERSGRDSVDRATARLAVARLLHLAGRFQAAATLFGKELTALRKRKPGSHEHASCLSLLADAELAIGKVSRARDLLKEALEIQIGLGLERAVEHAETHRQLANVLDAAERYQDALASLDAADAILCHLVPSLDERCLRNMADRAAVLYKLERYDAAEDVLDTARKECERTLGRYHTLTLEIYNSLGAVYERQAVLASRGGNDEGAVKWLAAARRCREDALAISERLFPPGHHDTTSRMSNLGMQRRMEGDLDGAEMLYRKALAFDERTFPAIHSRIAGLLINLASVLRLRGGSERLADALDHLRRALRIYERLPDATDLQISNVELNLASLLKQMGRWKEARVHYRRGLPVRVVRRGFNHPGTREGFGGLVDLMMKLGESYQDGAGGRSKRATKGAKGRSGSRADATPAAMMKEARGHVEIGDLAAARRLCLGVIAHYVRSGDPHAPELIEALELLASITKPGG